MSFSPSSTIFLCQVDFDKSYNHVRYFKSRAAQEEYFFQHVVKTYGAYTVVRKSTPDGGRAGKVQVEGNIEMLRSLPCNYMFFQNANHGNRYIYAFINDLVYINPNVTEIIYETDVFQTWFLDVDLMPSYVVREHAASDGIGENTVPEQFAVEDYAYSRLPVEQKASKWGYLVGATVSPGSVNVGGQYSGVYQGLQFYYYPANSVAKLNSQLTLWQEDGDDIVLFVAVIPEFNVEGAWIGLGDDLSAAMVSTSSKPRTESIDVDISDAGKAFGNYTPKNNKLHTAPYETLICTNHNGAEAEYKLEDFVNRNEIVFHICGDISANPSLTIFPMSYQGLGENYDAGIAITGFPQCALNTDTYKLWMAKNQFGINTEGIVNIGKILGGAASLAATVATGGASSPLTLGAGIGLISSGAAGIAGTISNVHAASKEPNRVSGMGAKNNLLTAIGFNRFDFYIRRIKEGHARTIDDYFTMFGYQTNRVKVPNVAVRKSFTYVQTMDVNIVGFVPNDDMIILKNIFNRGVTLWQSQCAIGNYTVDNGVI